jgi:hypothetical protein
MQTHGLDWKRHVRDECGAGAMYDALDALVLRLDEVIDDFVEGLLLPGGEN